MDDLTKYFDVKDDKCMTDLMLIHPVLLFIFADMNWYCHIRRLPVTITRVVDEQIEGVSTSTTHEEGRAFDMSLRGWDDEEIERFVEHFNKKYSDEFGAFSRSDGLPRLIPPVDHGTARHYHVQVRRGL